MYDSDGMECQDCERRWTPEGEKETRCPFCGSEDVWDWYPTIPALDDDLELVYLCEQRIPRDEHGVHIPTQVEKWLNLHGVTDPAEINVWAEMWWEISSAREAATAKRIEDRKAESEDDE